MDAIGLVNIVHNLNHGLDIGSNPIGNGTKFVIGVGANPGVPNIDEEIRRFEYKVQAGAEFAVTQPVFDLRLLEDFLRRIEHCHVPVVAGIWPLVSARNAEFMKNELRVSVPDEIISRMTRAATAEAARAEGVAIARDMLSAVRDMVQRSLEPVALPKDRWAVSPLLKNFLHIDGFIKDDKFSPIEKVEVSCPELKAELQPVVRERYKLPWK